MLGSVWSCWAELRFVIADVFSSDELRYVRFWQMCCDRFRHGMLGFIPLIIHGEDHE